MNAYHKHKCHWCGFVWQHHDVNDTQHGSAGAHECPGCHRCNWSLGIYTGAEEPRVTNGATPHPAATAARHVIHPDQNHFFRDTP